MYFDVSKANSLSQSFPRIALLVLWKENIWKIIRYGGEKRCKVVYLVLFQAHFFCKIQKNGYKVLYLSARAIGQVWFVNLIFFKLMHTIFSTFQKWFSLWMKWFYQEFCSSLSSVQKYHKLFKVYSVQLHVLSIFEFSTRVFRTFVSSEYATRKLPRSFTQLEWFKKCRLFMNI